MHFLSHVQLKRIYFLSIQTQQIDFEEYYMKVYIAEASYKHQVTFQ